MLKYISLYFPPYSQRVRLDLQATPASNEPNQLMSEAAGDILHSILLQDGAKDVDWRPAESPSWTREMKQFEALSNLKKSRVNNGVGWEMVDQGH